jgi:hypothetical protein
LKDKPIKQTDNERCWRIACTSARAEKQVAPRLGCIGIKYFLPLRKEFRKWSDRVKQILIPAFPSFIFVYLYSHEYFKAITQIGRVKYVRFGGSPAKIYKGTIYSTREIVNTDTFSELRDNLPNMGHKYVISSGTPRSISEEMNRIKGETHFFVELKKWSKYIMLPVSST